MWEKLPEPLRASLNELGQTLASWIGQHGLKIVLILSGAWLLRHFSSRSVSQILRHTIRSDLYPTRVDRDKRIETLNSLVGAAVRIGVYFIAMVMIIDVLGVDTGPLLASAGVLGVALGFGAQSLIKDFVSGIFIIVENQYRVGDVVTLGNITGVVEAITIRTTMLRDLDGNLHHIPNGTIGVTTNKTMDYSQVNVSLTVSYDTDVEQLVHVINHVGQELASSAEFKHVLREAPHFLNITDFGNNGLIIQVVGKTEPGEQWKVRTELYKRLKKAFDKNGITIPLQQITIHYAEGHTKR